jgi:lysophospholipase L1-like esterase
VRDYRSQPFERLVILGESTVAGGSWVAEPTHRFADVLVDLIQTVQDAPLHYVNSGIGANAISTRSPGYPNSAKPSAMERYRDDVIAHDPDLFVFCYGLNDMRAGMDVGEFIEDASAILTDVKAVCDPVIVLTTIYHMTGWRSFPPFDVGGPELNATYNESIAALAGDVDGLFADVWRAQGEADWLINPDGVHANRVGNMLIAHEVFATLARNCSCLTNATFDVDMTTDWTRDTTASREACGDPFLRKWRD